MAVARSAGWRWRKLLDDGCGRVESDLARLIGLPPRGRVFESGPYLNCPRCGLTIRPRVAVEHCPRCLALRRTAVTMFASTLPADELYGERAAPADDEQTEGPA